MKTLIFVAGGTGNLGGKIIDSLLSHGADVRTIVRKDGETDKVNKLKALGVEV